jgi:hypothetical protein
MKRAADQLKEDNETSAEGGVVAVSNEFRAHVQYSENGEPREIKGPRQSIEGNAKADLELIIAAAASMSGRAERIKAMSAEAHRLQERLEADGEAVVGGVIAERAWQLEREEIDAKASYMAALASRGGN